jgi:hypothetical protein
MLAKSAHAPAAGQPAACAKAPASPSLQRSRLLFRIREAKLPEEGKSFTLDELKAAGLADYKRPTHWSDADFRLFVLFTHQVQELRKRVGGLQDTIKLHETYHSPLWDEMLKEACPIKQAELRRKAEEDDRKVNEARRQQRDPRNGILRAFFDASNFQPWRHRDGTSKFPQFQTAAWHEPMTVMDYHKATGLSRRTVLNILKRAGIQPLAVRKRPNEPASYGTDANAQVLCQWLTRHVKDPKRRKALAARTLLHCQNATPEHIRFLIEAIFPALTSLSVTDQDFIAYLDECKTVLYPPPAPYAADPFALIARGSTTS